MHSDATRFNNPKSAVRIVRFKSKQKFLQPIEQSAQGGMLPEIQYDNAATHRRRKSQHLAEIAIERDESASLVQTRVVECLVVGPL